MLDTAVRSLDQWACLYALSDLSVPVIETEHGITNTQIPKCVCGFVHLFIYLCGCVPWQYHDFISSTLGQLTNNVVYEYCYHITYQYYVVV